MKQIPNIFTLLNLVFGCMAIIVTLQNGILVTSGMAGDYILELPEKIWMASLFIGLAAVIDFLDGFVARLLKASSEMGKQLDSLADVVSFGVAPAIILYQFLRLSVARDEGGLDASAAWLFPAVLIPCAAAYRLARFNIDSSQAFGFKGVPVPAAGLVIASIPLIYWHSSNEQLIAALLNKWVLYTIIFLLSYLMVSTLPIMALKFKDFSVRSNLPKLVLLAIALVAALVLHWLAVPVVFLAYIVVSLALKNRKE